MSATRVQDIERAIAAAFPPEWAEEWDRVGLLAGDPEREVTGVTLALDPTRSVIEQAIAAGDNVVVTHHPAFLKVPDWLTPGRGSAGVLFAALNGGVALVNAHTNLDRAPQAGKLLPTTLGLSPVKPIERSLMPMVLVTVFAPECEVAAIVSAMTGAGAGRIGEYDGASFASAPGTGSFRPREGSSPALGRVGERAVVAESRIEVVAPSSKARAVAAAARAAHSYEEPLITVSELSIARSAARMGMLSSAQAGTTLGELAARAAAAFGCMPRVWGPAEKPVERVATATGSAGSLIGDVLACRADVLVAGEVRYHDALDAVEAGLGIIELGHDVSEWPLVGLLADALSGVPGLEATDLHMLPARAGWWTP